MSRRVIRIFAMGLALAVAGPLAMGATPGLAQDCYSAGQVRQAVQGGEVISLSSVLNQIRAAVPGQIVTQPLLCDMGSRLVYLVDVLSGGNLIHVQIDARTGSIAY